MVETVGDLPVLGQTLAAGFLGLVLRLIRKAHLKPTHTGGTLLPGVAMIAVSFGLARYGLLLPEMRDELSLSSRPGSAG